MNNTDFEGTTISIGDTVIIQDPFFDKKRLARGTVEGFTPKRVQVRVGRRVTTVMQQSIARV